MCGSINKSPTKLNAAENKMTRVICLQMGKTTEAKPHRMNLRSPLSRIHYYQNKRLQVKNSSTLYQPIVEPLLQYPIGLVL